MQNQQLTTVSAARLVDIDHEILRLTALLKSLDNSRPDSDVPAANDHLASPSKAVSLWPMIVNRVRQPFSSVATGASTSATSIAGTKSDSDITLLRSTLTQLLRERDVVLVTLRSPTRHIPVEIWLQIFRSCLPDEPYIHPSLSSAPLLLMQVCRRWRQIAVSMPELWTSVSLVIRADSTAMVESWLARCGSEPLTLELVSLLAQGETVAVQDRAQSDVLIALANSTKRWRDARLCVRSSILVRLFRSGLPRLEHLQLSIPDSLDINTVNLAATAPNLRSFSSTGIYLDPTLLGLPWSQLTEFHCRYPFGAAHALLLLRRLERIEACTLRVLGTGSLAALPDVTVPHLRVLTLMIGRDEIVSPILGALTAPALRELVLRQNYGVQIQQWPQGTLAALFGRSTCAVERLCIKNMAVDEESAVNLVRGVPSLVELLVVNNGRTITMPEVERALQRAIT